MIKVGVAIPIAESVEPVVLQSMLSVVGYAASKGIQITDIGITHREIIDTARNRLTESFLGTEAEWLFWMDSDMTFPKESLLKLLKVAEDKKSKLVTGVYYQRKLPYFPVLWSRGDQLSSGRISAEGSKKTEMNKYAGAYCFPNPDKKEPFKVHAAGFGCALIHRSVFEVMDRPWFKTMPGICSEDFYFFVNAREMGFELWAEPTIDLGHLANRSVVKKTDFLKEYKNSNITADKIVKSKGEKKNVRKKRNRNYNQKISTKDS